MTVLTDQLQIAYKQGKQDAKNELMIATKPRDTGNPLNDMTGISGGKPLPKGTPAPKEMQLPIPGVDWRKFLVDLQINPDEVQPWRIEQEAPDDTRFTTPVIDGPFLGDPGIGPDSVPTPTQQYYDPVQTIADAQGLTDVLSPHQNPRSGSLKDSGLTDEQKIKLLIRGAAAYKA